MFIQNRNGKKSRFFYVTHRYVYRLVGFRGAGVDIRHTAIHLRFMKFWCSANCVCLFWVYAIHKFMDTKNCLIFFTTERCDHKLFRVSFGLVWDSNWFSSYQHIISVCWHEHCFHSKLFSDSINSHYHVRTHPTCLQRFFSVHFDFPFNQIFFFHFVNFKVQKYQASNNTNTPSCYYVRGVCHRTSVFLSFLHTRHIFIATDFAQCFQHIVFIDCTAV